MSRGKAIVIVVKIVQSDADLPDVALTLNAAGSLSGLLHGRQK
jgi:hypothetical protein